MQQISQDVQEAIDVAIQIKMEKQNPENQDLSDEITCKGGFRVTKACVNDKCNKSSLHCQKQQCSLCFGAHPFCKALDFTRSTQNNILYHKTCDIEQSIIKQILKGRQIIKQNLKFIGLPKHMKKYYSIMFQPQKMDYLLGVDLVQLKEDIENKRFIDKKGSIIELYEQFYKDFTEFNKKRLEFYLSQSQNEKFASKIIKEQGEKAFVLSALNNPRRLELMYRGSQNHFSAARFHQKCDDIQNTLVLVKTQFDKTIAGFTPLKWSCPSSWTAFADHKKQSFLLQVDLKEKIPLIESLQAIYCHQSFGPRFGRNDLSLTNKCNQNNCFANFPTSYNILTKYKNNTDSYKEFSGSTQGNTFRALQYQVFHVIF